MGKFFSVIGAGAAQRLIIDCIRLPLSAILLISCCSPHLTTYLSMSCSLACERESRVGGVGGKKE